MSLLFYTSDLGLERLFNSDRLLVLHTQLLLSNPQFLKGLLELRGETLSLFSALSLDTCEFFLLLRELLLHVLKLLFLLPYLET